MAGFGRVKQSVGAGANALSHAAGWFAFAAPIAEGARRADGGARG